MNSNNLQHVIASLSGGMQRLFWLVLIIWLLTLGGGLLLKGALIFLALLIALPIVGILALQWWVKKNVIQDNCPVCHTQLSGLNGVQFNCPSCGEPLQGAQGKFQRIAPEGTVDVQVVDVQVVDVSTNVIEAAKEMKQARVIEDL
ncbi:MAG: hypothetical protein VKJ24_05140 [Synechococcales bacterium]|nr:hypothetical protein [Synechococcales bacterium]